VRYPNLLRRYVASLIDGGLVFGVFLLYMREPLRSAQSQDAIYWPLLLLILYEPLLTRYACTLGQLAMGIRVRSEPGGQRVPVWRLFVRLFAKFLLGILSFIFMPGHAKKRAIHDIAAGTIVVDARSVHELRTA
jgi:uncharacterized RDD family membrane protein YckC